MEYQKEFNSSFESENNNIDINNITMNMAQTLNFRLHAEQFSIPMLQNFKIEETQDPQIVFNATDGMFIQQLVSDGTMRTNETLEQRIDLVVKNTINFMKKYSQLNNDNSLFYYKDYSNGIFNYKVYVQDFIIEVDNVKKIIRQMNAYFIEPNFRDFYQLTISSPALQMPTEILKLGVVDLINDQITRSIDNILNQVMSNMSYKKTDNNISKTENSDFSQFKVDSNNNSNEIPESTESEATKMYNNEEVETTINNEFDYSNIVVGIENLAYIVQYCDNVYSHFKSLLDEDEKKNERLKYEFKNFDYKKSYGDGLDIRIRQKNYYNNTSYKNYNSFMDAVHQGQLKNIEALEIELTLDYKKGKSDELKDHENSFKISFKPYDIKFVRKSNYNEKNMNQIEENINEILKKFPIANSIFCSK